MKFPQTVYFDKKWWSWKRDQFLGFSPLRRYRTKKMLQRLLSEARTKTCESEVFDLLRDIQRSDQFSLKEVTYERIAFKFAEHNTLRGHPWNCFYSPCITMTNGYMDPDLKNIDGKTILYWAKRAEEESSPLLSARYSGLVWEFSKKIQEPKKVEMFKMATIYCSSVVKLAELSSYKWDLSIKLRHALVIACKVKNTELEEQVKQAVLNYTYLEPRGNWIQCHDTFQELIVRKRITLTQEEKNKIVDGLKHLVEIHFDPREAGKRLLSYFEDDHLKKDIIQRVGLRLEQTANEHPQPLGQHSWFESAQKFYLDNGLKEDSTRMLQKMRQLGPSIEKEMCHIETTTEIPKKEIENEINSIFETNDLESIIVHFCARFIIRQQNVEDMIEDQRSTVTGLCSSVTFDDAGRPIAQRGPIEDVQEIYNDQTGHVSNIICSNLSLDFVLGLALNKLFSEYIQDSEAFASLLNTNLIIQKMDIDSAFIDFFEMYKSQRYGAAVHIIVPQIEAIIRETVEVLGGETWTTKHDSYDVAMLKDLIQTEEFKRPYDHWGDILAMNLHAILTDKHGFNLRNKVAHCLQPYNKYNQKECDLLIFVLFWLSLIRIEVDD